MKQRILELQKDCEKSSKFFAEILAYTVGPVELKALMENGKVKIIDARDKSDYETSHIPGAISVPRAEIQNRKDEFSKDETYVVYCYNQQCHMAANACFELADLGFPVVLLEGGFKVWTEDFHFAVSSIEE